MSIELTQPECEAVTGTREWADRNVNCCRGCSHDCVYCYARNIALRFKRTTPLDWPNELILDREVRRRRRRYFGTVMFPTTHDITPGNVWACEAVLRNLLNAGNRVLVVTKPHQACVERLTNGLVEWKSQILFRFTIGVMDDSLRRLWEPGAPDFVERLESLSLAHRAGYETSVSAEPLLEPWNVRALVRTLRPFVTHSIWIGQANKLRQRTVWKLPADHPEITRLLSWQTVEKAREIYQSLHDDPIIRWKDSYKQAVGLDRPTKAGLDV